jgi:GGDEF domain-containing protein
MNSAGTQRVDGASSGPAPVGELSRPIAYSAAAIDRTTDSALLSLTSAAVQRSRHHRCPVSLALVAIDRYGDLLLQTGPAGATDLAHWLRVGLTEWTSQRTTASLVGESTYAILWEDCPRSEALELTRRALDAVKRHRRFAPGRPAALTLSGGLATLDVVPRNFRPQDLIDAARRCLDGAQLSGGDTLKSIAF